MNKKIILGLALAILLACGFMLTMGGCNKEVIDITKRYDYALVSFPGGSLEKIPIQKWGDYEGEQLQITAKDGTVYLVSSVNCVLVKEGPKE